MALLTGSITTRPKRLRRRTADMLLFSVQDDHDDTLIEVFIALDRVADVRHRLRVGVDVAAMGYIAIGDDGTLGLLAKRIEFDDDPGTGPLVVATASVLQ